MGENHPFPCSESTISTGFWIIKGEAKTLIKIAPQFLLNFFGYKHARRLAYNSFESWYP